MCTCISLFFSYFNSYSQSDTIDIYQLSLQELMTLEAQVASFVESDIKKQPVSVTTISRKELELSGARTLADALSLFVPGFFTVEDQDDVIAGFRGLAPDNNSKVMLMVNGQNLNIEWFWGPPPAIFNTINFDFIERVEVIRGPGSVTLGQGALLGVINIITKSGVDTDDDITLGKAGFSYGMNNYLGAQGEVLFSQNETSGYLYLGVKKYDGQKLRNEGWAKDKENEGYKGGSIYDIGTRLKRTANNTFIGNFHHQGFELNTIVINHEQDLYNFYRDRNQFGETLISVSPSYSYSVNDNISVKALLNATLNDFSLHSVEGYTMGGTRENRYGGKIIFNINELFSGNRLAFGAEFRRFEFGRKNFSGNNFINNVISPEFLENEDAFIRQANREKILGYQSDINVFSFFAEDYFAIGNHIDLFGGIRFDRHPFWGDNLSPRIGAIIIPSSDMVFRASYQTGFRGAVGLHYGGGYRQDGLLSEENFSRLADSQIPIFDEQNNIIGYEENLPITKPESMQGYELASTWLINQNIELNAVGFYNIINNVIDVGVIWRDADTYPLPEVGTDIPGDWNGYWFFKNTKGEITQAGFEAMLTYKSKRFNINVSHSHVQVVSHSIQQRGSMYLTDKGNFKAYPENVTRLNLVAFINENASIGFNYLYYYQWYSPTDQSVKANHLVNLSASYDFLKKFRATISCTNLLNQTRLYPMNSNAGGADLSDGAPSIENTSVWLGIQYIF